MKINFTVRMKNKYFWIAFIPAMILLIQVVAKTFGFEIDLTDLQQNLLNVVNAVFAVLALFGVVNDPTTSGTSDSEQAMTYTEPKE